MTDDPNADESLAGQSELPKNEQLADEEVVESTPAVEPDEAEEADDEPAEVPTHRRRVAGAGTAAGIAAARGRTRGIAIDPALRIRDRVSEAFVIGTVLIFAAIFVNALAFGHGGAFTPTPTPGPSVVETLGPSESPAPTPVPIPTEFQVPPHSPSPGPSGSVEPSGSVAPSPS